jgi:hypothetical protein
MEKTVIKEVHEASVNAIKDIHKITNDRTPLTSNRGLKKYKVKFIKKFF